MKKIKWLVLGAIALITVNTVNVSAGFDENIVAIFGGGNPDTGWTTGTSADLTLALRAKNREDASTVNVAGVYNEPVGYQAPANNRARWNWEFSIDSGSVALGSYEYYIGIDLDPTGCINYVYVNALTFWNDNSYGDATTLNGQGLEGPATAFPNATIAQQSQNLVFVGGNPNLDATYNYVLFAVAVNDGPNGARIAETEITVIVGTGGTPCPDADSDGVPDSTDNCVNTANSDQADADNDGVGDVCDSCPNDALNDADGDGVCGDVDQCPSSDLRPYVDVNGNEAGATSIPNIVYANGCSIEDKVIGCAMNAKNHGDYVSCIVSLSNELYGSGAISKNQRQEMVTGAAKSNIGK